MTHSIYISLGPAIRARREAMGMTQKTLADLTQLSRTSVTNIERGGQAIFVHQLLDVAKALKIAPADLISQSSLPKFNEESKEVSKEFKALLARLTDSPTKRRSR